MPEALRTQEDSLFEEWAVNKGAFVIYFERSVFLGLVVPVVHWLVMFYS
jgi:hypothetical protein